MNIKDMTDSYAAKERLEKKNTELMTQLEELQRSNKLLSMTEKKYRNLYQKSSMSLHTITSEGILTECNEEFARVMGYPQEDIVGMSIWDFVGQVSIQDLKNTFEIWKKTNQISPIEIWCKRKNGNIFPVILTGTNLHDEKGNLVERTIALTDLTEIYKTHKELEYDEALMKGQLEQLEKMHKLLMVTEGKYKFLYEKMPILLLNVTTKGILMDCNEIYLKTLGYTKEEVTGIVIYDHVAEQNIKEIKNTIQNWDGASVLHTEVWMKRKDGSTFPALIRMNSIFNEDGNTVGLILALTDMTEIYNTTKKLEEEKTKRLSAVGQLASRIAHDLRNPLSVIKNTVDMMKIRNPMDEKTKADLLRLDRAVMRMAHQVDEVLDYVSPKPLNIQSHSVRDILINALERIVKSPDVSIELPQNDVQLKCDYEKLEAVFVNLITNAIQAMNNIGKIYLRIKEESENVVVEVEDTGPGIPDDVLPKIFDPLFTTRQVGTGLGLVSCKAIVEKHNGTIDIHTRVGKGTIFIIRLPK